MQFRITQQQTMSNAVRQAQARQVAIADLQDQLSTGLRVRSAADAPAEWSSLTAKKAAVARMDVDLENISTVEQRLNQSVTSLTEAGNVLVRARELALGGHQTDDRETLALEVDRLIDHMLSIANYEEGGIRLYAGTASHKKAFELTDVDELGRPQEVRYFGSNDASATVVGSGSISSVLPSGAEIFQQQQRGTTQYIGKTGAAAGLGTDNAKGVGQLQVRHTLTSYVGGNVQPGASSETGDTIIGATGTHVLTISDHVSLGRVASLNGGGPIPFDHASTDLKVVGSNGEAVFVDLSAVAASFTGDVEIESRGVMSVDDGVTEVDIDFSSSQILTDSKTGSVTIVDSTEIRLAGQDRIEYTGTQGVFESMMQLRDDLRAGDEWPTGEFVDILDARISDIERAHNQVLEYVGEQAVELSNLQSLGNKTRELQLVTRQALAETENADIPDVIVRLQNEQTHLQFIYAATANMNQVSLLDFLR